MTDEIALINDGMEILGRWEYSQYMLRLLVAADWENADELVREINQRLTTLGYEARAPRIDLEVAYGDYTMYLFPRLAVMNDEAWLRHKIWFANRSRGKMRPPIEVYQVSSQ